MGQKYKITIDVEYDKGSYPDPSKLLDSIQDNIAEFLSPYDEAIYGFEVCVEDVDKLSL